MNACLAIVATSLLIGRAALAQNAPPPPPANTTDPAGASSFQKLLVGGIQLSRLLPGIDPLEIVR